MKKRIFAGILSAAMLAGSAGVFAEVTNEKVEIAFKVGDSVLSINGQNVEVETPYIAGEGTTLVPLRVITEAFGAKVDWEGETQTVTMQYEDVNIKLVIGNKTANVNDHVETLDEAPVLTDNGVTMVPLRFISETFGAKVGYDDGNITVTKEAVNDSGSTVVGQTDMASIGDSYYGWSMDNPKSLIMSEKSFDGRYITFKDNNEGELFIDITDAEDKTLENEMSELKNRFSTYTLTKADILTDTDGRKYIDIRVKSKSEYAHIKEYIEDGKIYRASYICSPDSENINMLSGLIDSFIVHYVKDNTYDLSNVDKDGNRNFTDDKYKISMSLPVYFYQSEQNAENKFIFRSDKEDDNSYISMGVYSKTDDVTAQKIAQEDREYNKSNFNEKFLEIGDVETAVIGGRSGYSYKMKINSGSELDYELVDSFFEIGDYVYNISIKTYLSNEDAFAEGVLSSLSCEELDSGEIGNIIRNDEWETLTTVSGDGWEINLPLAWQKVISSSSVMLLGKSTTNSAMMIAKSDAGDIKQADLGDRVKEYVRNLRRENYSAVVEGVKSINVNGMTMYSYVEKSTKDDITMYRTEYVGYKDQKIYQITLSQHEVCYGTKENEEFKTAVESFEVK